MSDAFDLVRSPKLSIIIPVVHDTSALEETLVSVLENRPADCEIVVALGCEYADPWNIRDEVRFIQAPPGSSLVRCVNLGVAASLGGVVHVLGSGWRATEGWTERPMERFEDHDVAAVVPLGVAADDRTRIVSAGVRCAPGGRRIDVAADAGLPAGRSETPVPQGPVLEAGFWRSDALDLAGRGFTTVCGDAAADADMAVTLSRSGRRVELEPQSIVVAPGQQPAGTARSSFAEGVYAERLFWRSLAGSSPASLLMHAVEVVRHIVATAPLGTAGMLLGRLVAVLQFGGFLPRYLQLQRVIRQAAARGAQARQAVDRQVIRIDGPHAAVGRTPRSQPAVLRKSA